MYNVKKVALISALMSAGMTFAPLGVGSAYASVPIKDSIAITEASGVYNPDGATYQVFKNEACTDPAETVDGSPAILKLHYSSGDTTATASPIELKVGNYWVKEIVPAEDAAMAGIELDKNVYPVEVKASNTVNEPVQVMSVDPWAYSTRGFVYKQDKDTGSQAQAGGTLQGCVIEVRWWDKYDMTESQMENTPAKHTWYFNTDANGEIDLIADNPTNYTDNSGAVHATDTFTKWTVNGQRRLLLGTYAFREVKAPEGYTLTDDEADHIVKYELKQDDDLTDDILVDGDGVDGGVFKNGLIKINLTLKKVDIDYLKNLPADSKQRIALGQGNGKLGDAKFSVINVTGKPITYNGQVIENNQPIGADFGLTEVDGLYRLTIENLPYGKYKVVETKPGAGYSIISALDLPIIDCVDLARRGILEDGATYEVGRTTNEWLRVVGGNH